MKLSRILRPDPEKPSLRERGAALRAGLARLTRRPEPEASADQGRRAVMGGALAAAVPLPALAAPKAAPLPHPDQALLDAEAESLHTAAAAEAASEASSEAHAAFRAALGPCPEDLIMRPWEADAFDHFYSRRFVRRLPTHIVPSADPWNNPDAAWTADALRQAIALAPSAFGKAGQTPHHIRRWRGLLPLAEAYDARHDGLRARFRCRELAEERRAAEKVRNRAERAVHRIPATTVEGLAVHTRRLAATSWYDDNSRYTALLLSAAAVTGIALRQPDFDVAAWVAAWEGVGGRIECFADREEWAFISPSLKDASAEEREEVRRLAAERGSNSAVISRWLDGRA